MEFVSITDQEVELYKERFNLELGWYMSVCPMKVIENDKEIALIDCSEGMYGDDSIQIEQFEVFEKKHGWGSKIINQAIQDLSDYRIFVYVNDSNSKAFWIKKGFKPVDDGTGTEIYCYGCN
ncbi:hypothetical protein [Paenibacillus silvae]|uniref:hypothetical protein n=1 Tax=Paenibacillus silvae TaxID=1325358 RepID=UPI002002F63F|nr:hypothetical protein [Paenibacillus silvae]MCK6075393.1 hypothetical protein [Paenibacillus silvae]MCK6149780.1 hypothetical protein [Paenibacillus silvae]MCK6268078.1 hypothetical protein [Paenibacillus silvae]